jgi:hypothetical protein
LLAGLPDGFFSDQYHNWGILWRILECKTLLYILVIWITLTPRGKFYGHLVILQSFGTFPPALYQEKIWQPWSLTARSSKSPDKLEILHGPKQGKNTRQCVPPTPKQEKRRQPPGRPDWANFRIFGYWLLRAFFKFQ